MAVAAIGVATAVAGLLGSRSAARAAKRAAAAAARQEKAVTEERLRQIDREERSLSGVTLARSAGSGSVVNAGSPLLILAEQAREFDRERLVTREAGASRTRAALQQGDAVASQARAQGLQSLFQGIGTAVSLGYQSGLFTKKGP
jgi:transcription elongation GreA/GreB family factor